MYVKFLFVLNYRQFVDFLTTCGKKGDSVSIDGAIGSAHIGEAIEGELVRIFGENGYVVTSARVPDIEYLRRVLPMWKVRETQ